MRFAIFQALRRFRLHCPCRCQYLLHRRCLCRYLFRFLCLIHRRLVRLHFLYRCHYLFPSPSRQCLILRCPNHRCRRRLGRWVPTD